MAGKRKDVYLVVGGKYHDFDFARLELLKLLAEHDVIRVKVANDYSDVDAMCESDLLVTYTCDGCYGGRAGGVGVWVRGPHGLAR